MLPSSSGDGAAAGRRLFFSGAGLLLLALCCSSFSLASGGVGGTGTTRGGRPVVAGEQPLSKIAILRTSLAADRNATIGASPTILGQKGDDQAWVTVTVQASNPDGEDWIGVFSPANFNSSLCPLDYYSEEGFGPPVVCTTPIKYQYANDSNQNYTKDGKATLTFLLINQRSDFSFALFAGGVANPMLVSVSKAVAFANPKAPVFPRLAQGKSYDEMTVTWTSGYDIDEAMPVVQWGLKGKKQQVTPAGTLTFTRNSMCGPPARTVGWRDPGFIHTGFMRGLWPNQMYTYKVGHQLGNSSVWAKVCYFKAPPFPGQNSLQRIVIFGDMGKAERDGSNELADYQPGSLNTTDQLIKDSPNIDMVFHIGDMPYANGFISQWDQFTAQIGPIASVVPYMVGSGNHERDWPDSGSYFATKDSGGECGVLAETMFYVPAENRANFWYYVDYGMFRFCIGDTEHDWREGTEQYEFIENCFATVDRKHQPWLIFAGHRVLGYSSGAYYSQEGYEEPMGRESLQQLWQKYRVDIVFFGHVHNYERTCPIYQSQCMTSEVSHYSGVMNGTINAIVGGGGSHLSGFSTLKPYWSLYRDRDYGFVKLTAFNHSSLLYEYKRSSDGNVYDSFTITREYKDILSCVQDSCPPTTLAT